MRYAAKKRIRAKLISAGYIENIHMDKLLTTMEHWDNSSKLILPLEPFCKTCFVQPSNLWKMIQTNNLQSHGKEECLIKIEEDKHCSFRPLNNEDNIENRYKNSQLILEKIKTTLPISAKQQWLLSGTDSFIWQHQDNNLNPAAENNVYPNSFKEISLFLEEGAHINIIRQIQSSDTMVLSVYAAKNSMLNLIDISRDNNTATYYCHEIQEGAQINHLILNKNIQKNSRHVVETHLLGKYATTFLEGRFKHEETNEETNKETNAKINERTCLLDVHHLVSHVAAETSSVIDIKTAGSGSISQTMQTIIELDAEDANAKQIAKHLTDGKQSQTFIKPLLFIFNKNVSCQHGVAVGAIEKGQLDYLQTRGLNEKQAKTILLQSNVLPSARFSDLLNSAGLSHVFY